MQYDKYIYFIAFILVSLNGILVWSAVKTFEHKVKYYSSLIILMVFAWLAFLSYITVNASMEMMKSHEILLSSITQSNELIKEYNLKYIGDNLVESQVLNSLANSDLESGSTLLISSLTTFYMFMIIASTIFFILLMLYSNNKRIHQLQQEVDQLKSITTEGNN